MIYLAVGLGVLCFIQWILMGKRDDQLDELSDKYLAEKVMADDWAREYFKLAKEYDRLLKRNKTLRNMYDESERVRKKLVEERKKVNAEND